MLGTVTIFGPPKDTAATIKSSSFVANTLIRTASFADPSQVSLTGCKLRETVVALSGNLSDGVGLYANDQSCSWILNFADVPRRMKNMRYSLRIGALDLEQSPDSEGCYDAAYLSTTAKRPPPNLSSDSTVANTREILLVNILQIFSGRVYSRVDRSC